jgi:TRAP-type C4-dicarboxylate transport system substrate-binding protein
MKMKKGNILLSGIVIVVMLFFGALQVFADETFNLKGGTAGNISHPRAQAGQHFINLLEAKSGGTIKGKWYPDGQLGGEEALLSQLNNNTIQFMTISCALAGNLNPKVMTMYTPYLIQSWDVLFNTWVGSEGADLILNSLMSQGIRGLGWVPYGFNVLAYRDPPIKSLEDMKGRKIRSAASYTIKGTIEALGANAPPLPWTDVFMAIQQKTVDGCTAPSGTIVESRLYEVINNITESQHLFGTHVLWFRDETFKKMSSQQQKWVVEAAREACDKEQKEMKGYDEKATDFLKTKGVKVWKISDQEKARWVAATKRVFIEHEKKIDEKSHDGRQFMQALFKGLGRNYDKEILGN